MKIVFLNLYSNNNRGAESFINELIKHLPYETKIIGAGKGDWVIQPVHKTTFLKRFFFDPASLSVLLFTLKKIPELLKENPDWIVPMNGFWQLLIVKLLGKKTLVTGHSGPGWDEKWNLYLKPTVFVATTKPAEDWAKKACSWTKVVTIPYGIAIARFQKAKPVKINLERPVILCPAANVPYKRIHLAKAAVSKLKNGSLLHIGQGADLIVPQDEMPSYYAACDAVTLPSASQENSPMVFLEALAAGKTIIVTDTLRNRWILGEAGIYVNPENTNEYKAALEKRIDKKIILKQAEKYAWEKISASYEELFSKL